MPRTRYNTRRTMTTRPTVELIKSEVIEPRVMSRAARDALPRLGIWPISVGIIVHGLNTSYVNAIRRMLLGELETLALVMESDSWQTDDDFANMEMISRRIALIPIDQDHAQIGATFALDARNDSDDPRDVMTGELVATSARAVLPFFETINIVTIGPHRSIKFKAKVERGIGSAEFAPASVAVCHPLDERPIADEDYAERDLPYTETARRLTCASISDPRVHLLEFELTGTHNIRALLVRACDSLMERVARIAGAPIVIAEAAPDVGIDPIPVHVIKMRGETYTIGQLFTHVALDTFPTLDSAVCNVDDLTAELSIRIRASIDKPEAVIARTLGIINENLQLLRAAFESMSESHSRAPHKRE